jgi:DNA topoisomerase I
MNLVIVESPTKARKLSSYLGAGYHLAASVGHIRDLPKSGLGVDVDKNFEPTYEVNADKKDVIAQLAKAAKEADTIYLATDPDREGEAIAWHIQHILTEKAKKGSVPKFLRATFHEITKNAVMKAIEKPSVINMHLVDAQQARRVVDRLVGYKVSPVLWKKIRRGLSAGRVQSVALRLIVDREREIEAFVPDEYWEVDVLLSLNKSATLPKNISSAEWLKQPPAEMLAARLVELDGKKYEPKSEADVKGARELLLVADYQVRDVEKKQRTRASLPPFITSTLQQKSANSLGMSAKQTMQVAQQLYEEGLITYHRTDSFNLSPSSVEMARQYISQEFGQQYIPAKPRFFARSSKSAQEAHEAIRVTDVKVNASQLEAQYPKFSTRHAKLYDLIWRRFLASQMEAAVYDQTTILTSCHSEENGLSVKSGLLKTTGSILTFDGWMRLFPDREDTLLPAVSPQAPLYYQDASFAQKFTQPPPRYNDASLVKELEKRGIGRPSTYASIISVIEDRGYVERLDKRFVATPVGMTVSDFLVKHFPIFMEYEFTAEMEEDLDRIARGEKIWQDVVKKFYQPFGKRLDEVLETADRAQVPVEETGEKCPDCGEAEQGMIVIRSGKFGRFKSCNRFPECRFSENLVEKVEGVDCPLCQKGPVVVKRSRWGKSFFGCSLYPECNWASWKKPQPGEKVTQAEWAVMQEERAQRSEKRKATMSKKFASKNDGAKKAPAKRATVKKAAVKKVVTSKKASTTKKAVAPKKPLKKTTKKTS